MRKSIALISIIFLFAFAWSALAQDSSGNPEETVATLKQQLSDIERKETKLRLRLVELEEDLKPENIERALAGVGSTRPEELRERLHKQLTIERGGLQAELELLEDNRLRTEAALTAAEAAAYLRSALPLPTPTSETLGLEPSTQMMMVPNPQVTHLPWRMTLLAPIALFLLFGAVLFQLKRRLTSRLNHQRKAPM